MTAIQSRRPTALRSVALAGLVLVACATAPARAGGGWHEAPPLPAPRWFHLAASDLQGRIYVYGGRVHLPGIYGGVNGLGKNALVIFDPKTQSWRHGPPISGVPARARVSHTEYRVRFENGKRVDKPIRKWVEWHDYHTLLGYEKPSGAAGRDGRIYWFGESGPVYFDPATGAWGHPPPAISDSDKKRAWISDVPRLIRYSAATATAPDGRIYLIGGLGYPLEGEDRNPDPQNLYSLLDSVEVYDPAKNHWSEVAPLPHARQQHAAAFGPDGKLYVFGGYGHKGVERRKNYATDEAFEKAVRRMKWLGRHALRSVEIYDPATNTWSEGAPMPEGRNAMGAALGADGRIYVVGGSVSYSRPRGERDVFVYDPRTDTWSRGPELIHGRYHHAVAVTPSGKLYAIGGIGAAGPLASVEVLDTRPKKVP